MKDPLIFQNLVNLFAGGFDRRTFTDDNERRDNFDLYDLNELSKLFAVNTIVEEPFPKLFTGEHQLEHYQEKGFVVRGQGREYLVSDGEKYYNTFPHQGGGVLGHYLYLLKNLNIENNEVQTNLFSTRVLPNSIYKDFFCRDLPVIELNDAHPFVATTGPDFQTSPACMQCHATMDPITNMMSGLYERDVKTKTGEIYTVIARAPASPTGKAFHDLKMPSHLRYRNRKGEFVDIFAKDLRDFAAALSAQEDVYYCFSKKVANELAVNVDLEKVANKFQKNKRLIDLIVEVI